MSDDYILDLPNWKDVPVRFSGLDSVVMIKIIDLLWEYYKINGVVE